MATAPLRRIRIPADVEREDRVLGRLTARQVIILGAAALVLWVTYLATRHLLPLPAFVVLGVPIASAGVVLAIGHVEGIAADRLAFAAWRQLRAPRRLVPSTSGALAGPGQRSLPASLRLPVIAIGDDGVLDLGRDGYALVIRASSVTFSLRTPAEQEALVAAFGRYLNGLSERVTFHVRAEPVDLKGQIAELEREAVALPHPGLEGAARDDAVLLRSLSSRGDLYRREVLVVLREHPGPDAASRLRRRGDEALTGLGAAGVNLSVLDGPAAATLLARALDPWTTDRPASAARTGPIRRRR